MMAPVTNWRGHSLKFWLWAPLAHDVRWRLACYIVLAFTLLPITFYVLGALDYLINGSGQ
jgi:hypothetical protein